MFSIENEVKDYIEDNNVRVIYKVTIKYKNTNQIPTGILIEAVSLDDELSMCRFCYNTEKNVIFEYTDGTIIKNTLPKKIGLIIKKEKNKSNKDNENKKKPNNTNQNFVINRKTNEYHLYENNCKLLDKVEPKYIIETRFKVKELEKKDLIPCKKCFSQKN